MFPTLRPRQPNAPPPQRRPQQTPPKAPSESASTLSNESGFESKTDCEDEIKNSLMNSDPAKSGAGSLPNGSSDRDHDLDEADEHDGFESDLAESQSSSEPEDEADPSGTRPKQSKDAASSAWRIHSSDFASADVRSSKLHSVRVGSDRKNDGDAQGSAVDINAFAHSRRDASMDNASVTGISASTSTDLHHPASAQSSVNYKSPSQSVDMSAETLNKSVHGAASEQKSVKKKLDVDILRKQAEEMASRKNREGLMHILFQVRKKYESVLAKATSALHVAAFLASPSVVFYLLDDGAPANEADKLNRTPLWFATVKGCAQSVDSILRYGGNPLTPDQNGITPAHIASSKGHLQILESFFKIVNSKAMLDATDKTGLGLIEYAASSGQLVCLNYFISAGASIDRTGPPGPTKNEMTVLKGETSGVGLLHRACCSGNDERANVDALTSTLRLSPLHLALAFGLSKIAELLIKANADVSVKALKGHTAIGLACKSGCHHVIKLLIQRGASIAERESGKSLLMIAVQFKRYKVAECLIQLGIDVNYRDDLGTTALHHAICKKDKKMVQLLLLRGASKLVVCKKGFNAYFYAACQGCPQILKTLLKDSPTGIDWVSPNKCTALHWSAYGGNHDCVRLVLDTGKISVDVRDADKATPLFWAADQGNKCVSFLLGRGSDPNARDINNSTALMCAGERGYFDTVKELVEAGARLELEDDTGRTALLRAAYKGRSKVIGYLLEKGSDPFHYDAKGFMSLHYAAFAGSIESCRLLVDHSAYVNSGDRKGRTPLMWASRNGKRECVAWLLSQGANVNLTDSDGMTALTHASHRNRTEICKMLTDYEQGKYIPPKSVLGTPQSTSAEERAQSNMSSRCGERMAKQSSSLSLPRIAVPGSANSVRVRW